MGHQRYGAIGWHAQGLSLFQTYLLDEIRANGFCATQFAEYGLTHWGTDTQGVNTTRRFLCEAMSFQHRYVPIGLLERMPPQINERPPAYRGRNELGQS